MRVYRKWLSIRIRPSENVRAGAAAKRLGISKSELIRRGMELMIESSYAEKRRVEAEAAV